MINRDEFARALEEIRGLRALLTFERCSHDALRKSVKDHGNAAGEIAAKALRESKGVPTQTWQRASAEQAASLSILRRA
jgi:hypothetical protein